MYVIPLNAEGVLKIDCATYCRTRLKRLSYQVKNRCLWEGGVVASDGALYCMIDP